MASRKRIDFIEACRQVAVKLVDPEFRACYEAAFQELEAAAAPQYQAMRESVRLGDEDLGFIVRAV